MSPEMFVDSGDISKVTVPYPFHAKENSFNNKKTSITLEKS